ncbi:MAG: hypothetical protein Q9160_008904 [Pyrenula sp. 1 TL-2023]
MSQTPQGHLPPQNLQWTIAFFDASSGGWTPSENGEQREGGPSSTLAPVRMNDSIVTTIGPGSRDTDCPICRLRMLDDAHTVAHGPCGAVFCKECFDAWVDIGSGGRRSISCPMCRGVIGEKPDTTEPDDSDSADPGNDLPAQIFRCVRNRSQLIQRISQELLLASGDIAGVRPSLWVALSLADIELQFEHEGHFSFHDAARENPDYEARHWLAGLAATHQIHYWNDCELNDDGDLDDDDIEYPDPKEEHGAFPVLSFSPASISQLIGVPESQTVEGQRVPTHRFHWPPGPLHSNYPDLALPITNSPNEPHFDPATPYPQSHVIISPMAPRNRLTDTQVLGGDDDWISIQRKFQELEAIMNWLRKAFSHCRRHVVDIPRSPFIRASNLHRQLENYMGAEVPNFYAIARFMKGKWEWWKE